MSDFDRNTAARTGYGQQAAAIDAGLRAYMLKVYNYMAAGVGLTGVVAWLTYSQAVVTNAAGQITGLTPFGQAIFGGPLTIVLFIGTLGLVFFMSFRITRTFFISAASFGALSLYGYTTQRDLSPVGSFLIMGLFGLILAMVVNIFLKSTGLDFAISAIGVLIFAGLTAWDTQRIKEMYSVNDDGTVAGRKAVMGALALYLDFINLFLFLLRFMGDRR
jgi:FtsH-binding integral membrane protein